MDQYLDESLRFSVGFWGTGSGSEAPCLQSLARGGEYPADVAHAVIGHDPLDSDPLFHEPCDGARHFTAPLTDERFAAIQKICLLATEIQKPYTVTIDISKLSKNIIAGQRRALAQAITLVESSRPDHQEQAQALLTRLLPKTGGAIRLGFSGAPGVGKSTFIEAFGLHLIDQGLQVAVLAVDPSSTRSGGSILGDKTRMEMLTRNTAAFIRPSPSGGTLGGVARRTREAMLLTEAAGYDVVLIETVGVGQSETAVADMVDMFVLLLSPGGGDSLQGIKRGIMELADMVVVNKADGDLEKAANRARQEYTGALHLMRPKTALWSPPVLLASALQAKGIAEIWQAVQDYHKVLGGAGELDKLRASQARAWMWSEIHDSLMDAFRAANPDQVRAMEEKVLAGALPPTAAARELLSGFLG